MHQGRGKAPRAGRDDDRTSSKVSRVTTKKFRDRFVRQTIERANTLRDIACGVLRLRLPEARDGMDELRRICLPDPPPRGA